MASEIIKILLIFIAANKFVFSTVCLSIWQSCTVNTYANRWNQSISEPRSLCKNLSYSCIERDDVLERRRREILCFMSILMQYTPHPVVFQMFQYLV